MARRLLVTHHAPDLDAVGSVWLFKRFDTEHYGDAKIAFVNPGETITLEAAEEDGAQLHEVTHVDTGLGEFDHHQPERGNQMVCASSLVFEHLCQRHPDLVDDKALQEIVKYITEIDHFGEVFWPESQNMRYNFMIHELVRGLEFIDPHDDDSQLHFGMQCLDAAYAGLVQNVKAHEIISEKGQQFETSFGKALALETRNDDTIKLAQKQGFMLVVRKDPEAGHIRIKARPDADVDLKALATAITSLDPQATWYYHPSGKMLINGSRKHRNQKPSQLTLDQVVALIQQTYA